MICRLLRRIFRRGPKERPKKRLRKTRISTAHKVPGGTADQQVLSNLVAATMENEDSAKVDLNQKVKK